MHEADARRTVAGVAVVLLLACASVAGASAGDDTARAAIQHFSRNDLARALSLLDPTTLPPNSAELAQQIHELLVELGPEPKIDRVYWPSFRSWKQDLQSEQNVYHVVGRNRAALVVAVAATVAGTTLLTQFHCEPCPVDLRDRYPFTLFGLSAVHYGLAVAATCVLVTIVAAGVICIRNGGRRRWLWCMFIALGFGRVSLYWIPGLFNWTMLSAQVGSVSLFGVGLVKFPLYDPWRLSVSVPLGALVFLARQRRMRLREGERAAEQGHEADNA